MKAPNFIIFFLLIFGVGHIISSEFQAYNDESGNGDYCQSCGEDGKVNEIETAFVKFKQKCDECYELKETVIDPPEEEEGWCLDQYGCDPFGEENGEINIKDEIDGDFTVDKCLQKCWEYDNATGCEVVGRTKTCSYHTGKLSKGSGDTGDGPYYCHIHKRATLTPLTTTSIAPVSTSASKMTVTASFKETSIAGQTSKNKETSIAGQTSKNIETTKPTFLTTKPTEFVKPTTSIKTDPDDAGQGANPWLFGFAVKNQVEGHLMLLSIVSLFLFMI